MENNELKLEHTSVETTMTAMARSAVESFIMIVSSSNEYFGSFEVLSFWFQKL